MQFTDFGRPLGYTNVLDLLNGAQYDIMVEMAATDPPQDKFIGSGKAWTSDTVHLSIDPVKDRVFHSVCVLYLAAILRLWGLDSAYDFHETNMEFLKTTTSWPETIGRVYIRGVSGAAEN